MFFSSCSRSSREVGAASGLTYYCRILEGFCRCIANVSFLGSTCAILRNSLDFQCDLKDWIRDCIIYSFKCISIRTKLHWDGFFFAVFRWAKTVRLQL